MTRTRSRRVYTLAALALAAVLVAVLAVIALDRGQPAATSATGPASAAVGEGEGAPVEITSVDGEALTVPSDRPTVLYFMASWCSSCIEQARAMNELEDEYADQARFIGVDVTPNATTAEVDRFRDLARSPDHPYVIDTEQQFVEGYDIVAIDSTVVVAPDGEILGRVDATPMNVTALKAFLDDTLN